MHISSLINRYVPCFFQIVYYFPLKTRLHALFGLENYKELLRHEFLRPKNDRMFTDVYDSSEWAKLMGPPADPCERISLQFCSDAFQAFINNSHSQCPLSVKLVQYMVLSLPPSLRTQSKFMLMSMLLPSQIKNHAQKKYFDFSASYELVELASKGTNGIKVKIFGTSMDTPGRADLLGELCVCQCKMPPY